MQTRISPNPLKIGSCVGVMDVEVMQRARPQWLMLKVYQTVQSKRAWLHTSPLKVGVDRATDLIDGVLLAP